MNRLLLMTVLLVAPSSLLSSQTLPDHGLLDSVLADRLHDGLVDYAALAADPQYLDLYLEQLGRTSPQGLDLASRADRLAFWINAYNACAMRLVLDHYPIDRRGGIPGLVNRVAGIPANSIRQIPDTWSREFCRVAQQDRSLDGIEHGIIRPMGDPRIHFAVNCAARSCPVLAPEAYRGERLDAQLDAAVRRMMRAPEHFRIEPGDRPVLRVNKVLDWYKDDFGGEPGVIEFFRRYVDSESAGLLMDPEEVRLEFFEYDWTLNDTAVFGADP